MPESGTYFRPAGLPGIEALHASFIEHAYRPHSHPTWTVAVIERGAARFEVDDTRQRADEGELFVLEPEAVHTGMAAVPEGWTYKVLYVARRAQHRRRAPVRVEEPTDAGRGGGAGRGRGVVRFR